MDAIFDQKSSDEDDFYKLLACDELSSTEQINTEFKVKAHNLHPDKNLDDPKATEEFAKLQRARDVLTDEKKRNEYDFWRRSGLAVPYDTWISMKDSMHTSLHWAVKAKKEPMIEDNPERYGDVISEPSTSSNRQHFTAESRTDSHTSRFGWSRAPADDILKQFRSYQI
ncbi:dnaJ homolog subfamily C member 12-like [Amphiura filiformis]|uniref:dnaJ homolog subfamily C member 12-like n=1 Tax=Amphiura filiformis TaxID=82378 RepID=UPI003B221502